VFTLLGLSFVFIIICLFLRSHHHHYHHLLKILENLGVVLHQQSSGIKREKKHVYSVTLSLEQQQLKVLKRRQLSSCRNTV
jgi:ribosome-interacting GTPase 1